jgi:hypothetical protein
MIPSGPFYYTDAEGQLRGPHTPADIRLLLSAGVLTLETDVCTEGGAEWCKAAEAMKAASPLPSAQPSRRYLLVIGGVVWVGFMVMGLSWAVSLVGALVAVGLVVGVDVFGVADSAELLRPAKYIIAALLALCVLVAAYRGVQSAMAPQYRVVFVPDYRSERDLESFGREGWDIISVRRVVDGTTAGYEYHLRR